MYIEVYLGALRLLIQEQNHGGDPINIVYGHRVIEMLRLTTTPYVGGHIFSFLARKDSNLPLEGVRSVNFVLDCSSLRLTKAM